MRARDAKAINPTRSDLSLKEAKIALSIRYFEAEDLVLWVRSTSTLDEYYEDPFVSELLATNTNDPKQLEKVPSLFDGLVRKISPPDEATSEQSEKIAKQLFKDRILECLSGQRTVWEVCKLVPPTREFCEYPDWLDMVEETCDWVDTDQELDATFDLAFREHLELMDQELE